MSHSAKIRWRCCLFLLLSVFVVKAQVGRGWDKVEQCVMPRESAPAIGYVYFFNERDGVIAGDSGFLRFTRNGGITWRQPAPPQVPGGAALKLTEDILAGSPGGHSLYLITPQRMLVSNNRGESWTIKNLPLSPGEFDPEHGPDLSIEYYDVSFVNDREGWLLCGVLRKTNNKESFIQSYALYTNTAGDTWTAHKLQTDRLMVRMNFISGSRGWIVGDDATILQTENRGKTWEQQTYPVFDGAAASSARPKLLGVNFQDEKRGIIVGKQGTVLWTVNGGQEWFLSKPPGQLARPDGDDLVSVHFIDDEHAWIVGDRGAIFQTGNGGRTWTKQAVSLTNDLYTIFMYNEDQGWAAGDKRALLRYDAQDQ